MVAVDMVARPALERSARPEMQLKDVFLAGNFVETLPSNSSRYVTEFYEQAKEVQQAYSTIKAKVKEQDLQAVLREAGPNPARIERKYKSVNRTEREMSDLTAKIRKVEQDRKSSPEQKRKWINLLTKKRNRIAQREVANGR